MSYRIVAMTPEYLSSLRTTLDIVLKESLMFVFAEAPPMSEVTKFVTDIITHGDVQVIAVDGSQVIGWCDIVTTKRPTQRHCGAVALGSCPDTAIRAWAGRSSHRRSRGRRREA